MSQQHAGLSAMTICALFIGATAATSPFSGTVTLPVGSHSPTASFNSATASLRSFSSADLQFGRSRACVPVLSKRLPSLHR
eukprot:5140682-Amphidinium_carterae.1